MNGDAFRDALRTTDEDIHASFDRSASFSDDGQTFV